jgi:hypothetical protein
MISGQVIQALPRPIADFLTGAFGPLSPLSPIGIDAPPEGSERPEPRRFQYPIGWNMPLGQPGTEGLKLATFANLRQYADVYSIVRACIQLRKDEILRLEWNVVPTEQAEKEMRGDVKAYEDFQSRRAEALAFFARPDRRWHGYHSWMSAMLEDFFVCDALTLYLHPSRKKGKGLLGSDLGALETLDGTTIRPLLDIRGGTPQPPAPAYQQYLWGVPRSDFLDIILNTDVEEMDEPVDQYRADQLLYLPYVTRNWTPYGFPGVERALIPVITGLKRQTWALEYFTEGSIPGLFIIPGPDVSTAQQIRTLQDSLNALANDTGYRHKIIVLPPGSSSQPQKPIDLATKFDEIVYNQVLMAYEVQPTELGLSAKASTTMGAATDVGETNTDINNRKALKPTLMWLKRAIFDYVLQDVCQQDDMQWQWRGVDEDSDEESATQLVISQVNIGLLSLDEGRSELGRNPWGLPLTSDPVFIAPTGPIPWGQVPASAGASVAGPGDIGASATAASAGPPGAALTPPPKSTGGAEQSPSHAGAVAAGAAGSAKPRGEASAKVMKASLHEISTLARAVKRGRRITTWTPQEIPPETWAKIAKLDASDPEWVSRAKMIVKLDSKLSTRNAAVQNAMSIVTLGLTGLATSLLFNNLSTMSFVDGGVDVLNDGYTAAGAAAVDAASSDFSIVPDAAVLASIDGMLSDRADDQQGYLMGLMQDLYTNGNGDPDSILGAQIDLYEGTVIPAYEEAYGTVLGSTGDDYNIEWKTTDDEACELCQEHEDDGPFSLDSLPGWPGDGEFGGPVCLGGLNCRCTLIYSDAQGNSATSRDEPESGPEPEPEPEPVAAVISTDLTKTVPGGDVKAAATPGQRATCPCGTPAVFDELDGWQHADGSVSHDDGESVSEKMNRGATSVSVSTGVAPMEASLPGRQRVSPGAYNPAELPPTEFQLNRVAELHKAGNEQALIDWYNDGADGQIDWGSAGDFDACVAIAGKYLGNPEGFCNLRHQDATGEAPGHAAGEQEDKVFKALDPDAARYLSIGDRLVDEEPVEFAIERPDAPLVAVVKSTQTAWVGDTIFRVIAVRENEVELEPVG